VPNLGSKRIGQLLREFSDGMVQEPVIQSALKRHSRYAGDDQIVVIWTSAWQVFQSNQATFKDVRDIYLDVIAMADAPFVVVSVIREFGQLRDLGDAAANLLQRQK